MKPANEVRLSKYWKLCLGLATLVLLCLGTAIAQTTYTVTDLGTLGGTFGLAWGTNNKGWVVGFANLPGDTQQHAFLWIHELKIDLRTLGGPNSNLRWGVNGRGQVVGAAETSTPDPNGEDFCGFGTHLTCLPFLWQNGVMNPLPTLGGDNGEAGDINNRGQVAGAAENSTPDSTCPAPEVFHFHPVVWENGQIQELPTVSGDPDGVAQGINDSGQAVGASGNCTTPFHAVLWENGAATDLGNLGGTTNNQALQINNRGQIVGISGLADDATFHAFLWQNGTMTDLGTLLGDFSSQAFGINDKSQVVGLSCDINGNCRPFLWQREVMTDLNTLIPANAGLSLLLPFDINSRGQIVGLAVEISTGNLHAFLATPVNGDAVSGNAMPAARGQSQSRESPKVALPETIRKLLQRRLGFGRLGIGVPGWR
jgi:probable HAF family extracellular repeat protein